MECLRDTIGIEGCGAPTPSTGEYVNSLPGITTFMVGKIADKEQVTYLATWEDVQNRAIKKFASAVISTFKNHKKLKIKTVAQTVDLGRFIDDSDPEEALAQYRGIAIELSLQAGTFQYLNSSLQVIYVQSLALYSDDVHADFPIKVFNLDTGELLETITQTLAAGWNSIRVASSYDAMRIFIAYDATAFDSVILNIPNYIPGTCQNGCDTVYGYGNCTASVMGAVSSDLSTPTVIEKNTNTHGLSAVFSIQCRYDWLICNNLDQFTLAWQYCLGAELMTERIFSDRQNRYTNIDLEKARELREEFKAGFEAELTKAIDGIDISENDCCIECVAAIQKPYATP